MENVSHRMVKFMWGNSNYDYVFSEAAGNSGGILCIWEESFFKKDYVTISDSFVAIYGTWIPVKTKSSCCVYGCPAATSLRRVLWNIYLILLGRWNGEIGCRSLGVMCSHDEIRLDVWDLSISLTGARSLRLLLCFDCSNPKGPGMQNSQRLSGLLVFNRVCIYKVVTKILASRLAMVIAGLVSNTQFAVCCWKTDLGWSFHSYEVLDWCKRKKKKALFFKVDFAKAYDSLELVGGVCLLDYNLVLKGVYLEVPSLPGLFLDEEGWSIFVISYVLYLRGFDSSLALVGDRFQLWRSFSEWDELVLLYSSSGFQRPPAVISGGYTHQNGNYVPKKTEANSNNGRRTDKRFVGIWEEDFDGSDVEKEGDNNVSMVPDSVKEDVNVQDEEKGNDFDVNNSLDPFELYSLLNKKRNVEEKMDKSNETMSILFPPGFTPCDETEIECDKKSIGNNEGSGSGNEKGESVSIGSRKNNKIEIKRTGGSLLTVMEELIKVGKTMGYNIEGCMKNIEEIIEVQGGKEVFK
ncbi:hypothetical protein Tco_0686437 [Tanacetum coccineum]